MKCTRALERMLEADLEELLEGTDSPLAVHLGTCARCSGIARRILEEERALGVDLISATAAPDLDQLLVEAGVTNAGRLSDEAMAQGHGTEHTGQDARRSAEVHALPGTGGGSASEKRKTTWARMSWRRAILPLAAAAAAVSLLLPKRGPLPGDLYSPPEPASGLDLQVPGGRSAAVLETKDPNITILWFF